MANNVCPPTRVKSKLTGERRERNSSLLWEQPKRFIIVKIIIILIITIIINIIATLRAAKDYHHYHHCHYQIPPETASILIQIPIIIPTMSLFTGPALCQSWWQPERLASPSSYGHLRLHPVPSLREEVRSWFASDDFVSTYFYPVCQGLPRQPPTVTFPSAKTSRATRSANLGLEKP